jgi:acetolactate synthase I/II/III large subunit
MTKSLEVEQTFAEALPGLFPEASDLIIRHLERIGVEYVFGVPGGAIEPLFNALARSQRRGSIVPVVARHESGAAFMADGYARETGRLGVCCATTGPGATNLITGIASAFQDNTPMLAITAQTPINSFGNGAVQESSCTAVDTVAMLRHCTHYNTLVSHLKQLERKLVSAITLAFQARGPAHLSIPLDLLRSPLEAPSRPVNIASLIRPPRTTDHERIVLLARRIRGAGQIIVVVGEGSRDGMPAIIQFAESRGAVIVTTPQAKGLMDSYHPHYRGVCGLAGHRSASERLLHPSTELVLIVGSSLDEQAAQGWLHSGKLDGKLVHIDSLARNFVRSSHADLHVCGDIGTLFRDLLAELSGAGAARLPPWDMGNQKLSCYPNVVPFDRRGRDRRGQTSPAGDNGSDRRRAERRSGNGTPHFSRRFSLADETAYRSDATPLKPQRLMYELSRLFPSDTRYLADIGNSFLWGIHYLHPWHPDTGTASRPLDYFRTSMGFASMGWAIGAAVGTAIANPRAPVVCIVGDGSYLMSGQELTTAIQQRLKVIFVVLNDQILGTVRHGQRLAHAEQVGYELPPVDFAAMARAMGVEAWTIRAPADFDDIDIAHLCRRQAPALIDVHVDDEAVPPLSERMEMLATALHIL